MSSWVGIIRLATHIAPSPASLQDYTESEYKTRYAWFVALPRLCSLGCYGVTKEVCKITDEELIALDMRILFMLTWQLKHRKHHIIEILNTQ